MRDCNLINNYYPDFAMDFPLNPPECLWYQEWWLTMLTSTGDVDWFAGGVMDGASLEYMEFNLWKAFQG